MAIISVSITQSSEQIVAGIPKTVSIDVNIPATIFYTLDGTEPTLFSTIYTGAIFIPYDKLTATLKVFASNGSDTSPVITETYITNILNNVRLPHSATDAQAGENIPNLYPFGTNPTQPQGTYLSPADAGITVDNPDLPEISNGFDGSGNQTAFSNEPYNLENYNIIYSTTDAIGQMGRGIGNLPATVSAEPEMAIPEFTEQFTKLFDPRAMVIYQDFEKEDPNDPPTINRQFFTLENPERSRDGNAFFNTGLDAPPPSGAFVRQHYNPRSNTITYYYLDSIANRWIISTTPYRNTGSFDGNLGGMILAKTGAAGFVYPWRPYARRILF